MQVVYWTNYSIVCFCGYTLLLLSMFSFLTFSFVQAITQLLDSSTKVDLTSSMDIDSSDSGTRLREPHINWSFIDSSIVSSNFAVHFCYVVLSLHLIFIFFPHLCLKQSVIGMIDCFLSHLEYIMLGTRVCFMFGSMIGIDDIWAKPSSAQRT